MEILFDDDNQELSEKEIVESVQDHPRFRDENKETIHDLLRGLISRR